jgi:hypothetical protein
MALSLCSSSVNNTGELLCDKSRGILKKLLIFNGSIAAADYADADTFFDKLVTNSKLSKSAGNKIFVINEAQDVADASEANKEGSLGLGFKAVLLEGKPAYKVKFFAGGDLLKRLRTFNNQTIRVLEYDADGVVWGTKSGTSFKGFQAKLFFKGNNIATGQNVEQGVVEVYISILSTSEYFDNAYWMETSGNIEDIVGLMDVTLAKVSNSSNVYKYSMKIAGSNLLEDYNIYDDYAVLIAALTFTAKSGSGVPSASLAITSVGVDATLKLLVVTYDSTAHTAITTGHNIMLIPPTIATLDAADVTGVELLSVTHVK